MTMKSHCVTVLAAATSVFSTILARADEPVPRTPPMPGLFGQQNGPWAFKDGWAKEGWAMRPNGLSAHPFGPGVILPMPSVKPHDIAIENPVSHTFTFAIWDPTKSEWQQFEAKQGRTDITCQACNERAQISFHNGKEQKTYTFNLGRTVSITWEEQEKVWTLAEQASVISPNSEMAVWP